MRGFEGGRLQRYVLSLAAASAVAALAACASRPAAPGPTAAIPAGRAMPAPVLPAAAVAGSVANTASGREAALSAPAAGASNGVPAAQSPPPPAPVFFAAPAVDNVPVPPPAPPAVAAQFPEPDVRFDTPAFEPGRRAFTSNEELHGLLAGLARGVGSGERRTEIRLVDLGVSQSGQPLEALAFVSAAAADVPSAAGAAPLRRPVVLMIGGQHGDEPAGSEALVVLARQLASGALAAVLERVDVVLLPRANPDGAALFQRAAVDGTDVNRDHLLLNTPEARAQARLLAEFEPMVVLDLHEYPVGGAFAIKFRAVQRADALLQAATAGNLAPFIAKAAEEWFRRPLVAALGAAGLRTDWYATTSADPIDRKLSMGGVGAQLGRNASGLRNAVSLLVETRGGGLGRVDLKRRVQAHVLAANSVLAGSAARAADLAKLRQFVDRETASLACQGEAVLEAAPTPSEYALSVFDSETGAARRITVAWDSALELRVLKSRPRPCGYWLAASETEAVRRLRLLGIEVGQLEESLELRGETYREIAREGVAAGAVAQAGGPVRVRVQTLPTLLDLAAGGYYVSLEQPLGNLAVAILEPEAPSSYAANRVLGSTAAVARVLVRPAARMTSLP